MANTALNVCNEVWKDIPEWEGLYQASTLGRIRSVPRTKRHKSKNGKWFEMPIKGRTLALGTTEKGYKIVALSDARNGRKPRTYRVHRLVCLTFNGESDGERLEVAHANAIRDDNRLENLRWATRAENIDDRMRHQRLREG